MISDKLCAELIEIPKNFIPARDVDDLTQEVLVQLLDMPTKKLQKLIRTGEIHKYFNRMCKLNYYSKNSRYYYTYRKVYEHITFSDKLLSGIQKQDEIYIINDSDLIHSILDELYWYDRELFKLYVLGDNNSYTSLAKKTGISRISIYYTIKSVKKYIAKRLKEYRDDI